MSAEVVLMIAKDRGAHALRFFVIMKMDGGQDGDAWDEWGMTDKRGVAAEVR
jgi:hypothetical protein